MVSPDDTGTPTALFGFFIEKGNGNGRNPRYDFPSLSICFPFTMTPDFDFQLLNRRPGEPFVRIDTPAHREINEALWRLSRFTFDINRQQGNVSQGFINQFGGNAWRMFAEGALLAHHGTPWNMRFAGDDTHPQRVQVRDWDYFPRPSTDWMGNSAGLIFDPLVLRNFAMSDGDPSILTQEEYDRMRIAWEFVRMYVGDVRAWQARSDLTFGEHNMSALEYSFPVVVGSLYWDMLDIFFQAPERQMFANPNRFPGFQYLMSLWQANQLWGLYWNAFPMHSEGMSTSHIAHEWYNRHTAAVVGASISDANWPMQVQTFMPHWDVLLNERWENRFAFIEESLDIFHPPLTRP